MPKKVVEKFNVEYLQILNENGLTDELLIPHLSQKQIKWMYEMMVLTRVFDDKALKLQRQGRIGTYASVRGQEASQIGSVLAMSDDDLIFPAFRENGVFLCRNMPAEMLYQYWAGDERGMIIPENVNMFPVSITVGAHPLHAVGASMALKYNKDKRAVITYFGDGA